jgi:hypothetical protein
MSSTDHRRQLFGQSPRISALLQSVNHVIGDEVALLLAEPLAESPHELARPYKCEGERDPIRLHDEALKGLLPATAWREAR